MRTAGLLVCVGAIVGGGTLFGQGGPEYTALGDSLATGYLAQSGYVARFSADLQTDFGAQVTLYNLGQNGYSSGNLLNALQTKAAFQADISAANVVTWDIGLNDFRNARQQYKNKKCRGKDNQDCLRAMLSSFTTNWNGIATEILTRRSTADTVIRAMDIYDPWTAADARANSTPDTYETGSARGNDFQVLEYYLDAMNSTIALSAMNDGFLVAPVHTLYNGSTGAEDPVAKGYIGSDGIHPTDLGHQAIADAFRSLGYSPLR